MFYIYLKCNTGSGYYTGTIMTSMGQEVCVHPAKYKAQKFEDRNQAYTTANYLKSRFKCIISYTVKE